MAVFKAQSELIKELAGKGGSGRAGNKKAFSVCLAFYKNLW